MSPSGPSVSLSCEAWASDTLRVQAQCYLEEAIVARGKKPSTGVLIQSQDLEIRQLWINEWFRRASTRSDEWRAANPMPDATKVQWASTPLPDGHVLAG